MEKIFSVGGMACENCVKAVKEAVSAVPGVSGAEVSLADKCARVTCDETVTDQAVIDAIEDAGFDVLGKK